MKPDFSIIEPMACKCGSIEERDEILRQLDEWGVTNCIWYTDALYIKWGGKVDPVIIDGYGETGEQLVAISDFLSKFREVYEYWLGCNTSATGAIVQSEDNGIVFPSDDEVADEILRQDFHISEVQKVCRVVNWYKLEVSKRNQR